jgi:hypothetical protein
LLAEIQASARVVLLPLWEEAACEAGRRWGRKPTELVS